MSDSYSKVSDSSVARIVWCVAVHQPITASEIAAKLDVDTSTIGNSMTRLWRSNLLIRRKHPEGDGGGSTPYQYAIRVPENE